MTSYEVGRQWEEDFCDRVGGKLQPGSGNQWFAKLDVGDQHFLWSLKATGSASYRIADSEIAEAEEAVHAPGGVGEAIPGMAIRTHSKEFVVLNLEDFLSIVTEKVKYVRQSKAEAKREAAAIPILFRDEE